MRIELISVGTELLEGKVNTNVAYIGERLNSIGLGLQFESTAPDNKPALVEVFRAAWNRSDVIIVTGGLGPTFDDLTRDALASFLKRKLVTDQNVVAKLKGMFAARNVVMPENNIRQAQAIEGAKLLANPNGTAPGQIINIDKNGETPSKSIILLPGPPREMQAMFEASIFPLFKKHKSLLRKSAVLHICGIGESLVDKYVKPVIEAERKLDEGSVDFTILAHRVIVDLKTTVSGQDEMLVEEMLHNIKNEFYEILKDNIFGSDGDTLESVIGNLLIHSGKTLSVAESCTGGLVSSKITDFPGSSIFFKQGQVVYSNDSKIKNLGVSKDTIEKYGAVSSEVALELALGIKEISGSDYAISTTGIAGPGGATEAKPLGLVYIAVAGPSGASVTKQIFPGTRHDVRLCAANFALDLLRRRVLEDTSCKEAPVKPNKKSPKKPAATAQ